MSLRAGDVRFYDGALRVEIVKDLGDGTAIIRVGADTRVVPTGRLADMEG